MNKYDLVCHEEGIARIAGSDFLHFAVDRRTGESVRAGCFLISVRRMRKRFHMLICMFFQVRGFILLNMSGLEHSWRNWCCMSPVEVQG